MRPTPSQRLAVSAPPPAQLASLEALARSARYPELEACVQARLTANPHEGSCWKLLALALWMQGKDALPALEQAARLLPGDAESHTNLGNAWRSRGRPEEALRCHRRALALRSDYAEAHNNLGSALQDLGRTQQAVASFRRASALRPQFALAHRNLAHALAAQGQLAAAVESYRRLLALQPDDADACSRCAAALLELGRYEQAAADYRRALALTPGVAALHSNLGMVLLLLNETEAAEESCRRALELDPTLSAALVLRAELAAGRGQFAQAQELLREAISIEREMPEAWAALLQWRSVAGGDAAWLESVTRILERPLPPRREAHLRYALGRYFDALQDFPQAFAHYRRANELSRQCGPRYDRRQAARYAELVTRAYDERWLAGLRRTAQGSERAVFIVGMWRSGTTLAEQILASHPAVLGAGELPYWKSAAADYEQRALEGEAAAAARASLAAEYLGRLAALSPDAARVVDKMSSNFLHLGLIHACLPEARIIHLQRHPVATCLSIYFQSLPNSHHYANDLGDLAHYYREYQRVMAHWRRLLPPAALLEVPYEGLVSEPESWSRRMLEFIGLPWDARCLSFHETRRTVTSASKWQVRQGLHRGSVERWRHYRDFIAPLLELAPADSPP